MLILPKIIRKPTIEYLIDIHRLISGNAAYVASNLVGGQHFHLALKMTTEDHLAYMGHMFSLIITPEITPRGWVSPKNKRLETEGSGKPALL